MKIHDGLEIFIQILKLLSTLGFCAVFMYWSFNAISKYIDGPISSTVSYRFGDDGYGNIDFPAITICLDSFEWVYWSGMTKNCKTNGIGRFTDALKYCTDEFTQSQTTTTTWCGGLFGCMFYEDEEEIYPFKNIEDFLNASKVFDITDILSGFQFGQKYFKNKILVDQNTQTYDIYEAYLKDSWKPTLHFERGFCYTFEPKRYAKIPVLYKGELLSITLNFQVSLT